MKSFKEFILKEDNLRSAEDINKEFEQHREKTDKRKIEYVKLYELVRDATSGFTTTIINLPEEKLEEIKKIGTDSSFKASTRGMKFANKGSPLYVFQTFITAFAEDDQETMKRCLNFLRFKLGTGERQDANKYMDSMKKRIESGDVIARMDKEKIHPTAAAGI